MKEKRERKEKKRKEKKNSQKTNKHLNGQNPLILQDYFSFRPTTKRGGQKAKLDRKKRERECRK